MVRVLVVDDGATPTFTSLLPVARRWYDGALGAWRPEERDRRQALLDTLLAELPRSAEVVQFPSCRDAGRTIAAHANDWPADVVVIGRDRRGRIERALLGSVHEAVVQQARCAVIVIPAHLPGHLARSAAAGSLSSRATAPGGA
jgi:nucleotide-binding universal stress UspA family protein